MNAMPKTAESKAVKHHELTVLQDSFTRAVRVCGAVLILVTLALACSGCTHRTKSTEQIDEPENQKIEDPIKEEFILNYSTIGVFPMGATMLPKICRQDELDRMIEDELRENFIQKLFPNGMSCPIDGGDCVGL